MACLSGAIGDRWGKKKIRNEYDMWGHWHCNGESSFKESIGLPLNFENLCFLASLLISPNLAKLITSLLEML